MYGAYASVWVVVVYAQIAMVLFFFFIFSSVMSGRFGCKPE